MRRPRRIMRKRTAVAVLALAIAAIAALPALAATQKIAGTVGPGFTISVAKKPTKAGKYTLVVNDKSSIHNFHLKGAGVNVKTSVPGTGSKTFTVTLKKGKYSFLCDPHPTTMFGSFTIK
jgi:plastocyanin